MSCCCTPTSLSRTQIIICHHSHSAANCANIHETTDIVFSLASSSNFAAAAGADNTPTSKNIQFSLPRQFTHCSSIAHRKLVLGAFQLSQYLLEYLLYYCIVHFQRRTVLPIDARRSTPSWTSKGVMAIDGQPRTLGRHLAGLQVPLIPDP